MRKTYIEQFWIKFETTRDDLYYISNNFEIAKIVKIVKYERYSFYRNSSKVHDWKLNDALQRTINYQKNEEQFIWSLSIVDKSMSRK